jgi:BetR domain
MSNKQFAERLNKELDSIGVPSRNDERIKAFARMLDITPFKAGTVLDGSITPDQTLLQRIAKELEISAGWLLGSEQRQKKTRS